MTFQSLFSLAVQWLEKKKKTFNITSGLHIGWSLFFLNSSRVQKEQIKLLQSALNMLHFLEI